MTSAPPSNGSRVVRSRRTAPAEALELDDVVDLVGADPRRQAIAYVH